MNKRAEKSCFEMVQGKQEVLTGDPDGLTWEEFEKEVMRWAQPMYGTDKLRDWFVVQPITRHIMD